MVHAAEPFRKQQSGFTLIELLLVVGILALLFALSTIGLGQAQTSVSVASAVDTMVSDIKGQQLLAMAGDVGSNTSAQPHGLYIQSNQYTLYAAATYSGSDANNFVVNAPANITFSSTFSGGKLLFNKGDGSVNGFVNGNNTITVAGTGGNKTITVDRFGATTIN